jgi:uncharacterized protein YcbK (DUF882 family)
MCSSRSPASILSRSGLRCSVVRGALLFFFAVLGLALLSASANARRVPARPLHSDPALDDGEDEGLGPAWGPVVELATAEQGVPFTKLKPLRVVNVNTRQAAVIALYDAFGRIDAAAGQQLDQLLGDWRDPSAIRTTEVDRRVLRLIYRAAYHFKSKTIQLISGYRQPGAKSQGRHGAGRAVDFRLPNVSAFALASYLRTSSRVGVGVYSNPNTRFVHLDHRDRTFFWLDGSPPGRSMNIRPLDVPHSTTRDDEYDPAEDWPEGTKPSPLALVQAGVIDPDTSLDMSADVSADTSP